MQGLTKLPLDAERGSLFRECSFDLVLSPIVRRDVELISIRARDLGLGARDE